MKIVKKIIKGGVMAALCICLFSCGSTKKAVDAAASDDAAAPETEVVDAAEDTEVTAETAPSEEVTEEKTSKKDKKSKKKKGKKGQAEDEPIPEDEGKGKKKNYVGWVDATGRDIDFKNGIIRLRAKPRLGTYNISLLSESGKYVPVLSTRDEYTGSAFYLKVDKKIYKLAADANINTMAKRIDDGVKLLYRIANVADVEIALETIKSKPDGDPDMIKVTAMVTNMGTKKAIFGIKSILDTVLGESTSIHFYDEKDAPVKSETMYRSFADNKWFISQNSQAKMQIFTYGKDISKIDNLALANYSTLDIKNWEPDMLNYRAFDTVLSYNNSAIGITWPTVSLPVEESATFVYYIGLAVDSNKLDCVKYIFPKGVPSEEETAEEIEAPAPAEELAEVLEETPAVVETPLPAAEPEKPAQPGAPKIVSNAKFDVAKLTKEQLSPEYIQNLLDRIAALEEDDTSINQEELLQLNAELDAILEMLKE